MTYYARLPDLRKTSPTLRTEHPVTKFDRHTGTSLFHDGFAKNVPEAACPRACCSAGKPAY